MRPWPHTLSRIIGSLAVAMGLSAGALATSEARLEPWRDAAAPALSLPALDGAMVDLSTQQGAVVIVHFFATWCEPCRDELQSLNRLVELQRDAKLTILAVNVAEVPARIKRFIENTPVAYPVLLDADRAVTKAWGVYALPTSFILDRSLAPLFKVEGDLDWTSPEVAAALEQARATKEK